MNVDEPWCDYQIPSINDGRRSHAIESVNSGYPTIYDPNIETRPLSAASVHDIAALDDDVEPQRIRSRRWPASIACGKDRVHLDLESRQVRLDGGPGWPWRAKELGINSVHGRKIGHLSEIHSDSDGVDERHSSGGCYRLQIAERLASLVDKGALDFGAI